MSTQRKKPHEGVGYCHPPEETRFKKGLSGNPSGRPTKQTNSSPEITTPEEFSRLIVQEMMRPVKVTENGAEADMPGILAVLRSGTRSAIKGKPGAQKQTVGLFANALVVLAQSKTSGLTEAQDALARIAGGMDQNAVSKLYSTLMRGEP